MKSRKTKLLALTLLAALAVAPLALAEAKKAKYSVKDVMQQVHKGEDNIGKRINRGTASAEDLAKMVEYYSSLPLNDPPRGDKASWQEKTAALVKAADELKAGRANALDHYKKAANCKACHDAHKPE
jgi:hypothetical protein